MDAFQLGLSRPIPLEKAAAFFVGLKSWQPLSPEDDALMAECIRKEAALLVRPTVGALRAQLHKIAAEAGAAPSDGAALASPTPPAGVDDVDAAYLQQEQEARAAEEQNASTYYQQILGNLRQELAQLQEQTQAQGAELAQLQQDQATHAETVTNVQQEAQLAQQAALQQTQSANAQAATAMQQAVDAENRALQAKSMETTSKIQQQQLRGQLLELAAQGLPGTEPEVAPPEATLNTEGQAADAAGMPGQQASGEIGAEAAPAMPQPVGDSSGAVNSGPEAAPQSQAAQAPEAQAPAVDTAAQPATKISAALAFLEERRGGPLGGLRRPGWLPLSASGSPTRSPFAI